MMRTSSCCLAVWLAACGGADQSDDAAAPPATTAASPAPSAATSPSPPPTPAPSPVDTASFAVRVGGEADMDACGGWSRIRKPAGAPAAAVEVRRGPGQQYAVTDRLPDGAEFFSCDSSNGWSGLVYQESGDDQKCGVSTPIAERQPYPGPCKSGWIPSEFAEVLAG
jgi:hypothetical protein